MSALDWICYGFTGLVAVLAGLLVLAWLAAHTIKQVGLAWYGAHVFISSARRVREHAEERGITVAEATRELRHYTPTIVRQRRDDG